MRNSEPHTTPFTPGQDAEHRALLARNSSCPGCGGPARRVVAERFAISPEAVTFCDGCGTTRFKAR